MSHVFSSAVELLIQLNMASGKYASEDELLVVALEALASEEDELRAIQEGLDSVERGEEGVSLEEAFAEIRAKYRIRESA